MLVQPGPAFLAFLSLAFGCHGMRELVLACRLEPFDAWVEKALPGAGGVILGALLAISCYRLVGTVGWCLR